MHEQLSLALAMYAQPLLFWHRVVELCVVEQQTTLWLYASDVLVTMVPADIAPGIDATRIELLGRAVMHAARSSTPIY